MEIVFTSNHSTDFDVISDVQMAILHDTIEDTDTSYDKIVHIFGQKIADAALTLSVMASVKDIDVLK